MRAKVGGVDGDASLQILWHLFHWGMGGGESRQALTAFTTGLDESKLGLIKGGQLPRGLQHCQPSGCSPGAATPGIQPPARDTDGAQLSPAFESAQPRHQT